MGSAATAPGQVDELDRLPFFPRGPLDVTSNGLAVTIATVVPSSLTAIPIPSVTPSSAPSGAAGCQTRGGPVVAQRGDRSAVAADRHIDPVTDPAGELTDQVLVPGDRIDHRHERVELGRVVRGVGLER